MRPRNQTAPDLPPARGGTLLALWIFSLLAAVVFVLFGVWPWFLCWLKGDDLLALRAGDRDPTGRPLARAARRLAIVGLVGFALLVGLALIWLSKPR